MDYSIIIPVFNKAGLTRQCLATLRESCADAGDGEVIVIDNGSSDETPQMLREFPWVRAIRNDVNRGYAAANNQGAALASGEYLVLLNNDIVAHAGWLASMLHVARSTGAGAVGARLLFPNGTLQHAGVRISPTPAGAAGFVPIHDMYGYPGDYPDAGRVIDMQVVTGACLLTPRALYAQLGGLDEGYWNGYEDVDYCLRVRERGLRVVYDGEASLTHFESQSGAQRFRRVAWNVKRLAGRWNGRVRYDAPRMSLGRQLLRRTVRVPGGFETLNVLPTPRTTVICHGETADRDGVREMLAANRSPVERITFVPAAEAVTAAREEMERRGDRYVALVDARAALEPGWLDELIAQTEFSRNTGAATYAPELPLAEDVASFTADARCTLLSMSKFPQHLRIDDLPTLDGAIADFLIRAIPVRAGVRGVSKAIGALPPVSRDASFQARHGMSLADALTTDTAPVERTLRSAPGRRPGLVTIVMLSWNAPEYTKIALDSIRRHTRGDYEIVIVDNGSKPETVEWLRTLQDVRVIYNASNRGYAGGNNQAIAAACGEYVVLLNNDVVVTEGWLDGLLAAFDRIPGLGVSAPRSNRIAGDQITPDATYADLDEMQRYAQVRRRRFWGEGYLTDRAIGLCLCIDRRVIDEIGGIDERFGAGNFEDDDFCLRVRGAGYRIFVCDDVFIHHFGSQTFAANKIDWAATMRQNWTKFARKWGFPETYPENGYVTTEAIRRGFDRTAHYVPLPVKPAACDAALRFTASVADEQGWNDVGAFVRRYAQAFSAHDPTALTIHTTGTLPAVAIRSRVHKIIERLGLRPPEAARVEIVDASADAAAADAAAADAVDVHALKQRSPSALRAMLEKTAP